MQKLAIFGIVGLPLLLTASADAQVIDQQQTYYNGGMSARTLPGYTVWQSFTAGLSGTLVQIDMGFFNDMNGQGTLRIYSGDGTGGSVLETETVPITALTNGGISWNSWAVDVSSVAGNVYTFEITPDAATLPDPYGVCLADPGPYAGGELGINDPSGTYPTQFDMCFRTYVATVPEPSSLAALGLFALFGAKRRSRQLLG